MFSSINMKYNIFYKIKYKVNYNFKTLFLYCSLLNSMTYYSQ